MKSLAVAVAGVLATVAAAAPVTMTTDGTWFEFAVGGVGDPWRSPLDGDVISFAIASPGTFSLRVVDVGFAGDRVDVLLNGLTALGSTSDVPVDDTVFAFTADEALAAPATWSQGVWSLAPGSYAVTGIALASPFGGGTWAISALAEAAPSVPEPGSLALMLGGLSLGAAATKRRRR